MMSGRSGIIEFNRGQSQNETFKGLAFVNNTTDRAPGNLSRITIIELYDPIPEPEGWWDLLKGILIMKLAILCLTFSGIFIKFHYERNPHVTVYDMVFVRAFA